MERYAWVRLCTKTHKALRQHTTSSEHANTNGVMHESSWTVQKASSHCQPDWSTRCCWSALRCRRWRVLRHSANHMSTRNVPVGRWKEGLNKSKRRAHIASLIRIHVSVGQRCRAGDVEPAAILPKKQARNVPAGAMDESPGEVQDASHT